MHPTLKRVFREENNECYYSLTYYRILIKTEEGNSIYSSIILINLLKE
jgi:hypothetical protein